MVVVVGGGVDRRGVGVDIQFRRITDVNVGD